MKTPGLYVPLDVNYVSDEGIRRAGAAAELLYIRGLAYSKRTQSDGFLPDYDMPVISVGLPQVRESIVALVERELWIETDGGWQIRSWRRWNEMHGDAADKRKRAAERQRRSRERKAAEAAAEAAQEQASATDSDAGEAKPPAAEEPEDTDSEAIEGVIVTDAVTRDVTRTSRVTSRGGHTTKEKRREETTEEKTTTSATGRDTSRALAVRGSDSPPAGAHAQTEIAPASDAEAATAQTLVKEWLDSVAKRPPQTVIGQTAKHLKQLLDEGIHVDDIRLGLRSWIRKGLHPSTLPSEVNAVMNANNNVIQLPTGQVLDGTDSRIAGHAALTAQLRAIEARETS
jgi:hypothetical protein